MMLATILKRLSKPTPIVVLVHRLQPSDIVMGVGNDMYVNGLVIARAEGAGSAESKQQSYCASNHICMYQVTSLHMRARESRSNFEF